MTISDDPSTSVDPAIDAVFGSQTVYRFSPDPLPEDTLDSLYALTQFAPTAFNSQPLRLVVVTGESKARLITHLFESNKDKTATAPLTFIAAADTDFHDHLEHTMPHAPGLRNLFLDDTFRATVANNNAWLQLGYVILGLRSLGLGVGPMSGLDANGITNDLLAGTALRAIAVVNVGYAADADDALRPRNPRLEAHQVITRL